MDKNALFPEQAQKRASSPDQLDRYIKIVTPGVGLLLAGLVCVVIGALIWATFGAIPLTTSAVGAFVDPVGGVPTKVVCVVDAAEEAQRLQAGMRAQIAVDGASRDEYGYVLGEIADVSQYPIAQAELAARVGNDELARLIMLEGAGRLVTIDLTLDSDSANGLAWSSNRGASMAVHEGTTCSILFILREQKPIELIWNEGIQ